MRMWIQPSANAHADPTLGKFACGSDVWEMRMRIRPLGNAHADPTFRKCGSNLWEMRMQIPRLVNAQADPTVWKCVCGLSVLRQISGERDPQDLAENDGGRHGEEEV